MSGGDRPRSGSRLRAVVRRELADRDGAAVVHCGTDRDPSLRYCLGAATAAKAIRAGTDGPRSSEPYAIAHDGESILAEGPGDDHPAARLADRLVERGVDGTLLAPRTIPHDAALYLERAGFDLASTDAIERARAVKTAAERDRVERAQRAASAGVRRAASLLTAAETVDGGLELDGEPLTGERLRRRVDEAVVRAGAFPAGNTIVEARSIDDPSGTDPDGHEALPASAPIVVDLAPREPGGYHGGLARTLIVDGEGGWERRAHVAITHALRSAKTMLVAGPETIAAVEADLEAEARAFGFGDEVRATVRGVGLEPRERPRLPGQPVEAGSAVRLEVEIEGEDGAIVRLADLLSREGGDSSWLDRPSRSIDPATVGGS